MEKNRALITLIILCITLSLDSLALPDSDSIAETHCSYSNISIHSIQGAGHKSPIAGCFVSGIQGIVTLNTSNGFYMQDPHPDNDNSTSEGIFVYTALAPKGVQKGDLASVDGTVYEYSRNARPVEPQRNGNSQSHLYHEAQQHHFDPCPYRHRMASSRRILLLRMMLSGTSLWIILLIPAQMLSISMKVWKA